MSNPFYFAFDILEGKKDSRGRDHPIRMLCHAVIFTSFEVPLGSEATCTICADDVDPRMQAFIRHVWCNFLKERKRHFEEKFYGIASEKLNDALKGPEGIEAIKQLIIATTNEPKSG